MNKPCIAIIGGSSGDALIEACKTKGIQCIAFFGRDTDRGCGAADENYLIDLAETEKIVKIIQEKTNCLLLGTGHIFAHKIAKELYDSGFLVSIDPNKAEYGKNKILAYEFIKRNGYNTPDFIVIESETQMEAIDINTIPLPCVVKSENDAVKTAKANNLSELHNLLCDHFAIGGKIIVEQFIDGIEYTMPVVSDGIEYNVYPEALDMEDINRIAIAKLKNFDNLDKKYNRKKFLTNELRTAICTALLDITRKFGFIGLVRYDIMVDTSCKLYILEVNEVATSRLGPEHYPWETVGLNPAMMMVENIIARYYAKK